MTTITGRWRVTIIWCSWWALSTPESSSEEEKKNRTAEGKQPDLKTVRSAGTRLTGGGYEIEETFLGEKRVFQPSKIELQDPSHRVDVVVTLVIHQGVFTCNTRATWHVQCHSSHSTSILHYCSNGLMCLCICRKKACTSINTWHVGSLRAL